MHVNTFLGSFLTQPPSERAGHTGTALRMRLGACIMVEKYIN